MAEGPRVTTPPAGKVVDLMAALKEALAKKALAELTKEERSLLLFFETNAVDHGGALNTQHMNEADLCIAARWVIEGFIRFGRIAARSLPLGGGRTHYVELSPEAVMLAQEERRARIERLRKGRNWSKARE